MEVRATRIIAAPPERIFAFLEAFDRHWALLGRRLQPLRAYDGQRSQARLRGPLGIRRTLWIELSSLRPPTELTGRVEAGRGRTVGTVRWTVRPAASDRQQAAARTPAAKAAATEPATRPAQLAGAAIGERSIVELTARTDVAGRLDRLLLACGGRRWLRRSLELVLARLDERLAAGGQ